ncbi:MAG: glycyl-radical enzyme activating protein [Oscillospiraceae bacterium]|nr:glycyl-radical enzyme activating protein [Oscillospiraceae bacterium]
MTGTIFDLKRFAVHDGGGIRSTLFLKGCPLRCPWCQNPEGLRREITLWHQPALCVRCGTCAALCPRGALTLTDRVRIEPDRCDGCGLCVSRCPAAALQFNGRTLSAEEAAAMLLRDRPFFGEKGGVTLSGGEVLMQPEFAREVLRLCRGAGADTAIETCLYAPRETVASFLPLVDHFLIDIKYFDSVLHRAVIGVPNEQILENYRLLTASGADVLVRTPLIPGYTASEENIRSIARFVVAADPNARIELLNFNPLCRSKYAALNCDYPVAGGALTAAQMEFFRGILREEGLTNLVKES